MVLDQLAAMAAEGRQVRVIAAENRSEFLVGRGDIAVEIDPRDIEIRLIANDVPKEIAHELIDQSLLGIIPFPGDPALPAIDLAFAARREARDDFLPGAWIAGTIINFAQGGKLRLRQTGWIVTGAAEQLFRLEAAGQGILDHPVLVAALFDGFRLDQLQLLRSQITARRGGQRLIAPRRAGKKMNPVVGRIAGDNAVKVLRITLCFHQGFAPAVGAALKIGKAWRRASIGLDDRLGRVGGFFQGAIAEVDLLFRMAQRPAGIGIVGILVTVIGAGHGVTLRQARKDTGLGNDAGKAAIADLQIAPVPGALLGDRDLEPDIGIACWMGAAENLAIGG